MKKVLWVLTFILLLTGCMPIQETKEAIELEPLAYPNIRSQNVLLLDVDTKQVLWEKAADETIPPASITKLMTAILAIEKIPDLDETLEFTQEMMQGLVEADANRAGFVVGDAPTMRDYIYGDLLPSGADCSRAIAYKVAGGEKGFVELMNEKAKELGMSRTHFENTSGLFETSHYSTCRDLATLFLYCIQNETFMEMIQTERHVSIPVDHYKNGLSMDNYVLVYVNKEQPHRYVYSFDIPGFIGGKGGYTIESRYNLASMAEVNGRRLMLITIHAYIGETYPAALKDAETIYRWAGETFQYESVLDTTDEVKLPEVLLNDGSGYLAIPSEPYEGLFAQPKIVTEVDAQLVAPIHQGEKVGVVKVYDGDYLRAEIPLVASQEISMTLKGVYHFLVESKIGYIFVVGILLLILILFFSRKPKKRKVRL